MRGRDFTPITSIDALSECIRDNDAALIWFTGPECRVCQDLKPRVRELIWSQFPKIALLQVDCANTPDIAAQNGIFSVPSLLIFMNQQEVLRLARNFSLGQIGSAIQRPYRLFFED